MPDVLHALLLLELARLLGPTKRGGPRPPVQLPDEVLGVGRAEAPPRTRSTITETCNKSTKHVSTRSPNQKQAQKNHKHENQKLQRDAGRAGCQHNRREWRILAIPRKQRRYNNARLKTNKTEDAIAIESHDAMRASHIGAVNKRAQLLGEAARRGAGDWAGLHACTAARAALQAQHQDAVDEFADASRPHC
ncbi:SAC3 domain-containing protein 1 [Frankliniella fusca]|uniref:SAC3 domain-containing protein 1 n=1 Tax=Frankliniella fusca TaxID=407009 RepID=A0AAE1HQ00_9NEOP|nr:SAC3 domain-containing protein 1 [Frankliniella fusca]